MAKYIDSSDSDLSDDNETPSFCVPESQNEFNNLFTPVHPAPGEIRFGSAVPEETKRMTWKWMAGRGGGSYAPAVAFYSMFPNPFAYVDRCWFSYRGPHWEEENGTQLPRRLVHLLRTDFYRYVARPIAVWAKINWKAGKDLESVTKCRELFKKEKELRDEFKEVESLYAKNQQWKQNLGANPNLLGLEGGHVFDWTCGFRPAVPEDFLIFHLRHSLQDLDTSSDQSSEAHNQLLAQEQQVLQFLTDIMPNQVMADYLLDIVIFILSGRVREFFQVFVGFGANGKGVLISLLKRAFGPYFCAPDVSLFMGRGAKQHGAADPEMAKLRGTKVAVAQEPEPKDNFRVGTLKSLASADTLSARQLYQNPTEFVNTALPILACNLLPGFRDASDGFPRRARVVEFPFKFVDNPQKPNEKPIDKAWQRRAEDPAYGAALLRLAFKRLSAWMAEHPGEEWDIVHPSEVQRASEAFRVENDPVVAFKEACLIEDENQYITQGDMYKDFKDWVKSALPGDVLAAAMTMKELKAALGKHGIVVAKSKKGKLRDKEGYLGWRLRDESDEKDRSIQEKARRIRDLEAQVASTSSTKRSRMSESPTLSP